MRVRGKRAAIAVAAGVLALAVLLAITFSRPEPDSGIAGATSDGDAGQVVSTVAETAPGNPAGEAADPATGELVVYRSPGCVCCERWAEHMQEHGFAVRIEEPADLMEIKREHGVSRSLASCHTAVVDGYVIEGHVPADLVLRLLEERPEVDGLAVPGMPVGSPGMEGANPEPYDVFTFDDEGGISVYDRR